MISDFNHITDLCDEIDGTLKKPIDVYIIGGAMLLYHGIKPATKDIDVIVETPAAFIALQSALNALKFTTKRPTTAYQHVDISQIFTREDFRIDIFTKTVCKQLSLTPEIKARAERVKQGKHLGIYLCAFEDVFLFKTLTDREGDIDDCIALAKRGINWDIILDEMQAQIASTKNDVWITYVGERFNILQERSVVIPIMKKVIALCDKYYKDFEKRKAHK